MIILIFVALVILSAGCTATDGNGIIQPIFTPSTGLSHSGNAVDSQDDTQLREVIPHLDTYAEKARERWNVPGMAVAIVKDGKIVFVKAYGTKTAGGSDPVTPDTVFEVGSTSKAFMAALVAMEVDSGRMNWNDPVIQYVPDFQMSDPWITKEFTLTDALAHRSGLYEKWGQDLATLGYNQSETIHALRYAEPVTGFRTTYRYQNIFYIVDAAAVENTSGMDFEQNVKTRIFTPLDMKSGSTGYAAFVSEPDHAGLHMIGELPNGTLVPVVTDPDWRFNTITDNLGPAGEINANVKDMATWTIFQLGNGTYDGKRLISPENMAYMHTPRIPMAEESTADSRQYYCQGWIYQEMNGTPPVVKHTGETLGNHAYILMVPQENLGIVVLANEAGIGLNEDVGDTFYRMYYSTYTPDPALDTTSPYSGVYKDFLFPKPALRPENPASPLPLEQYTGIYTSTVYGTATVAEENGNLTLTLGKDPITLYLSPWDGNTFKSTCPVWTWGPAYDGRVTFGTSPDGTVRNLTTSLFLQKLFHQDATFVRTGAG
ncbi:serine hydrolase [Methanoregula sp.]|uniref:serine hydrolase n=1 Tax=Methanoregula sp. TaxID=2052170 RepID=UPI00236B82D1|nr:serine hydrolase [Methanoregula sp.]MDD1687019.1 serine hydrolase [Methanoregula sp.]